MSYHRVGVGNSRAGIYTGHLQADKAQVPRYKYKLQKRRMENKLLNHFVCERGFVEISKIFYYRDLQSTSTTWRLFVLVRVYNLLWMGCTAYRNAHLNSEAQVEIEQGNPLFGAIAYLKKKLRAAPHTFQALLQTSTQPHKSTPKDMTWVVDGLKMTQHH